MDCVLRQFMDSVPQPWRKRLFLGFMPASVLCNAKDAIDPLKHGNCQERSLLISLRHANSVF